MVGKELRNGGLSVEIYYILVAVLFVAVFVIRYFFERSSRE